MAQRPGNFSRRTQENVNNRTTSPRTRVHSPPRKPMTADDFAKEMSELSITADDCDDQYANEAYAKHNLSFAEGTTGEGEPNETQHHTIPSFNYSYVEPNYHEQHRMTTHSADVCNTHQRKDCRHCEECRDRHIDTTGNIEHPSYHLQPTNNTPNRYPLDNFNTTTESEFYNAPPCRYWISNGTCSWGEQCRFSHSLFLRAVNEAGSDVEDEASKFTRSISRASSRGVNLGRYGGTHSPQHVTCRYWSSSGRCRWVDRCRYRHDAETRGQRARELLAQGMVDPQDEGVISWLLHDLEEEVERKRDQQEAGECGLTAEQVLEALSQGVEPYDDEAWQTLFELRQAEPVEEETEETTEETETTETIETTETTSNRNASTKRQGQHRKTRGRGRGRN
jgi:hypothetical protein